MIAWRQCYQLCMCPPSASRSVAHVVPAQASPGRTSVAAQMLLWQLMSAPISSLAHRSSGATLAQCTTLLRAISWPARSVRDTAVRIARLRRCMGTAWIGVAQPRAAMHTDHATASLALMQILRAISCAGGPATKADLGYFNIFPQWPRENSFGEWFAWERLVQQCLEADVADPLTGGPERRADLTWTVHYEDVSFLALPTRPAYLPLHATRAARQQLPSFCGFTLLKFACSQDDKDFKPFYVEYDVAIQVCQKPSGAGGVRPPGAIAVFAHATCDVFCVQCAL